MWGYIIGGATMFAVIVGFFSVYNGRATRKLILGEERRTQGILDQQGKRLERVEEILDRMRQTSDRAQQTLDRHGEILEKLSDQHNTMIEILRTAQNRNSHP